MNKLKEILIFVGIPVFGSLLGYLFTDTNLYQEISKPFFAPPSWVFGVVWPILYLLMIISSYIIYKSNSSRKLEALIVYFVQLIVNFLWTPLFFALKLYLFSSIWILILIILVAIMLFMFLKIEKVSAYLNIPYFIWIIYAFVLNISIYFLNR